MSGLFRKEVLNNKGQRLFGEVLVIQPPSFYMLTTLFTLFVILIITLLFWGTYARKETVQGYLVPDTGLVKIYARGNGTVEQQWVEEGSLVAKGDKLLAIDTHRSSLDISDIDQQLIEKLQQQHQAIDEKSQTKKQLYQVDRQKLAAQIAAYELQVEQLQEQQQTFAERVQLSDKHMVNIDKLLKNGNISTTEHEQSYEVHLRLKLGFNDIKRQLTNTQSALEQARFELERLPMVHQNQLKDLAASQSDIARQILELQGRRSFSLHAPQPGRVTALQTKAGKTVNINDTLMAILPEGASFDAELFVPTRAVGFIKPGQKVSIRFAAFPYQRFGVYSGTVSKVAGVILTPEELPGPIQLTEPVYRISVALDSQFVQAYGQQLPLQAGMLLDADIILDQLTLIDWLLDPLKTIKGQL